jgi:hypothetical protein
MDAPAQKQELKKAREQAAAPAPLRDKTDEEALAYLKAQKEKRENIQARITDLQKQRDAELATANTKDAFDEKVVESLRQKAAEKGIKY